MSLLKIENLTKQFGGLTAVSDVNISLEENELVGLIGPNGAGKTTLFNLITGVYAPTVGSIELADGSQSLSLVGQKPNRINDLGLARTFQNIRLFSELTVMDNVLVAMHSKNGAGFWQGVFRTQKYYNNREDMRQKALELLKIFALEDLINEQARNLAYGKQRRLEIVRALATEPKIIFLDEPAAGMNPNETAELTELIYQIQKDFGVTIVLIEHDMSLVMKVCERIYVLENGTLIAQGTPAEIQKDKNVLRAYLGGE